MRFTDEFSVLGKSVLAEPIQMMEIAMLIIAGELEVDVDDRDDYVRDCEHVVGQARRASGCLDFRITADPLEPDRVNVYERWESDQTTG